mmetsp:Transcript_26296/g.85569  ORF Transcript_26296/g.85569 Transcript_26296/m.85569 type:complete len:236 (-) Transcript_26296:160-867(-)
MAACATMRFVPSSRQRRAYRKRSAVSSVPQARARCVAVSEAHAAKESSSSSADSHSAWSRSSEAAGAASRSVTQSSSRIRAHSCSSHEPGRVPCSGFRPVGTTIPLSAPTSSLRKEPGILTARGRDLSSDGIVLLGRGAEFGDELSEVNIRLGAAVKRRPHMRSEAAIVLDLACVNSSHRNDLDQGAHLLPPRLAHVQERGHASAMRRGGKNADASKLHLVQRCEIILPLDEYPP